MKSSLPLTRQWLWLLLVLISLMAEAQPTPKQMAAAVGYTVPVSPAMALLPSQPSEVINLVTPKDFVGSTPTFVSNGKIKTGVGVDFRVVGYIAKVPLTNYQKSWLVRAAYRAIAAIGTAPDPTNNNDAFLSFGVRSTLVDLGDPTADKIHTDNISQAISDLFTEQPVLGEVLQNDSVRMAENRSKLKNDPRLKSIREQYSKDHWNSFRVDVGYAFMARAKTSSFRSDSLSSDRWGFWLGAGGGLGPKAQWNFTAKTTQRTNIMIDNSETSRNVAGGRIRYYVSNNMALSAEIAQLWSKYSKNTSMNETWTHFAVIGEINVPSLGGWLTLGYGGDTTHRTATDSKFVFSYAVATTRLFTK